MSSCEYIFFAGRFIFLEFILGRFIYLFFYLGRFIFFKLPLIFDKESSPKTFRTFKKHPVYVSEVRRLNRELTEPKQL